MDFISFVGVIVPLTLETFSSVRDLYNLCGVFVVDFHFFVGDVISLPFVRYFEMSNS